MKKKQKLKVLRYPFKVNSNFAKEATKDEELIGCILVSDKHEHRDDPLKYAFWIDRPKTCHLTKDMYYSLIRSSATEHVKIVDDSEVEAAYDVIARMIPKQRDEFAVRLKENLNFGAQNIYVFKGENEFYIDAQKMGSETHDFKIDCCQCRLIVHPKPINSILLIGQQREGLFKYIEDMEATFYFVENETLCREEKFNSFIETNYGVVDAGYHINNLRQKLAEYGFDLPFKRNSPVQEGYYLKRL